MNTKGIQEALCKMQVLKFHLVCENVRALSGWEFDVISMSKSNMIHEFEVKVSRGDFKADWKKGKIQFYSRFGSQYQRVPNYFSYACPTGMIRANEVPLFAGLYYFENGEIAEIKPPKRIHKMNHDRLKIAEKIGRLTTERAYLGGARLTYENRKAKERWDEYQRNQLEE